MKTNYILPVAAFALGAFIAKKNEGAAVGKRNVTLKEYLEKELRKLQRDLNSNRLSTYIEGDESAAEMARIVERNVKLERFNEVLKLLNQL